MKTLLITLNLLAFLVMPVAAFAQQSLLSDPEIYEKKHFQEQCTKAEFSDAFVTHQDINNDGLIDTVVNEGELTCDGEKGPGCNDDGCTYNFYLQVAEGGYFMIATAQIYGYDFVQRFGNMVLAMKMHPRFCDRPDADPTKEQCTVTARVRGTKFVTISKK
ncbi:hypothetical protein A6U87_26390 [Rhizobium sp. AC44/96]|uniref:hypothetical protein n=1 Tax=unclassified Rhizobium TaxID=2613769 RepID=UPI00080F7701|nr:MULTISPECIES: hypothetical protein [unclassified Rhizobium]MDM9619583.1 hypothetical protein [Rhizobium sp. S96]OCJ14028.1 hypothetical protein A6U87_26390 [Rhizobium sp. AC44/96]